MSQKPVTMDHLKQVIQLRQAGVPIKEIVRRVGISRNSVRKYLHKLGNKGADCDSKALADLAYGNEQLDRNTDRLQALFLFFTYATKELSRTGVTRQLLWHEYLEEHPGGYGYSQFCYHLQKHQKQGDLAMHLEYQPGDMAMTDYAGKHLCYTDEQTGELISCTVFVSVLPFSGLIYCQAVHSQQTADFISCINGMHRFYKGVSATILVDNHKAAVIRASKYEPVFTDICEQLSEHYGTTFSATRPYRPRDKAMVERAVRLVYTDVYAPLRNHVFTSLQGLNSAIQEQLELLNQKPYKNTAYSRRYFYEQKERPVLKELPTEPFAPKRVRVLTVQRNYHVQLKEEGLYFSVPYQYVGQKVKVLYDSKVLEVYAEQGRIALHMRRENARAYNTLAEHMPPHHQRMQEVRGWNKEDLLAKAKAIGPSALQAATYILENSVYMEQNYKACFGMLLLQNKYTHQRLEAACNRALAGTRVNYTMIRNILERGLDKQTNTANEPSTIPAHDNIRGKDHYQ
jgi:transposase